MATKNRKKKNNNIKILACILLVLLLVLLLLIGILVYMLKSERQKIENGLENGVTPTSVAVVTSVPEPVETTQEPVPTATAEPLPTATPIPTEPVYEYFNSVVTESVGLELKEIKADLKEKGIEGTVSVDTYDNNYYVSVVFKVDAGDSSYERPMVYVKETGEEVKGSNAFKPTYFAILQESVDVGVAYKPERYDFFYMDDNKAYFYLNGEIGKMGTYIERDLAEAKLFLITGLNGETMGYQVRTDLDPSKPMMAITFDDGPYAPVEATLLEELAKYNAKCTFFFVGNRIVSESNVTNKSYLESLRSLAADGHEIASHTYTHKLFTSQGDIDAGNKFDIKDFWHEINKNNLILAQSLGYAPDLLRTPGGMRNNYMENLPMPRIYWSVDSRDWADRSQQKGETKQDTYNRKVKEDYEAVMKYAKDGQIVLMHSLYPMSAEGALKAISELSEQGYQFVTVSELAYYKGVKLEPGKSYSKFY